MEFILWSFNWYKLIFHSGGPIKILPKSFGYQPNDNINSFRRRCSGSRERHVVILATRIRATVAPTQEHGRAEDCQRGRLAVQSKPRGCSGVDCSTSHSPFTRHRRRGIGAAWWCQRRNWCRRRHGRFVTKAAARWKSRCSRFRRWRRWSRSMCKYNSILS